MRPEGQVFWWEGPWSSKPKAASFPVRRHKQPGLLFTPLWRHGDRCEVFNQDQRQPFTTEPPPCHTNTVLVSMETVVELARASA